MRPSRVLAVLAMTSACGRIDFDGRIDAGPDAKPPHDEDADGFFDDEDVCPHIADPLQADLDGDRVGDQCDPLLSTPTERIVFFDPFVDGMLPAWTSSFATPTFGADSIETDTKGGELLLELAHSPEKGLITVGGRINGASAVNRRQVQLAVMQSRQAFAYCELYEYMSVLKFGLVWTVDNFAFNTVDASTPTQPLANQSFLMTMTTDAGITACGTSFPVDDDSLAGNIANITPTYTALYVQGLEARFDYFLLVRTE